MCWGDWRTDIAADWSTYGDWTEGCDVHQGSWYLSYLDRLVQGGTWSSRYSEQSFGLVL